MSASRFDLAGQVVIVTGGGKGIGKVYVQSFGRVYCAKLHHDNDKRCIFHHGYEKGREEPLVSSSAQPGH